MTNHPTGDTALARAITTGAPVATNDKQAAELTQSRPTPGGEWYAVFGAVSLNGNTKANAWVAGGDMPRMERIFCESRERAEWLSKRLSAADAMEAELAKVRKQRDQWILIADELAGMSADLLDALPSVPAVEAARNKLSRARSMMNVSRRDQQ